VFANEVKSDGYLIKDIEESLTQVAIQRYLGTTEGDFRTLWDMLVAKIENREIPKVVEPVLPPVANPAPEVVAVPPVVKKHRGRVKGSKNKKNETKTTS